MVLTLSVAEIENTYKLLKEVSDEQQRILNETKKVVQSDLVGVWECEAQRAYSDAFLSLEHSTLSQINYLVTTFEKAFQDSQILFADMDKNLAKMNLTFF